jgi:hypothetical protein
MKTISTDVYTYAELDANAKEKAREWWMQAGAGDTDWADYVECDFHETLKALGFDPFVHTGSYLSANDARARRSTVTWSGFWSQGDGAAFGGTWRASDFAPDALLKNRPASWGPTPGLTEGGESKENAELHRIAGEIRACVDAGLTFARLETPYRGFHMSLASSEFVEGDIERSGDAEIDETFIEAARDLARAFYKALEAEYEYQHSEEQIAEAMEANEYTFTVDGRRFG